MATQNRSEQVIERNVTAQPTGTSHDTYVLTEEMLKTLLLQFLMWSRAAGNARFCRKVGTHDDGSSNYERLNRHRQKDAINAFMDRWKRTPLMDPPRPLVKADESLADVSEHVRTNDDLPHKLQPSK